MSDALTVPAASRRYFTEKNLIWWKVLGMFERVNMDFFDGQAGLLRDLPETRLVAICTETIEHTTTIQVGNNKFDQL